MVRNPRDIYHTVLNAWYVMSYLYLLRRARLAGSQKKYEQFYIVFRMFASWH
jgi:hypothetical protein